MACDLCYGNERVDCDLCELIDCAKRLTRVVADLTSALARESQLGVVLAARVSDLEGRLRVMNPLGTPADKPYQR